MTAPRDATVLFANGTGGQIAYVRKGAGAGLYTRKLP